MRKYIFPHLLPPWGSIAVFQADTGNKSLFKQNRCETAIQSLCTRLRTLDLSCCWTVSSFYCSLIPKARFLILDAYVWMLIIKQKLSCKMPYCLLKQTTEFPAQGTKWLSVLFILMGYCLCVHCISRFEAKLDWQCKIRLWEELCKLLHELMGSSACFHAPSSSLSSSPAPAHRGTMHKRPYEKRAKQQTA